MKCFQFNTRLSITKKSDDALDKQVSSFKTTRDAALGLVVVVENGKRSNNRTCSDQHNDKAVYDGFALFPQSLITLSFIFPVVLQINEPYRQVRWTNRLIPFDIDFAIENRENFIDVSKKRE